MKKRLHPEQQRAPRILIYGVTPEQNSALLIVHGFYPYCYFQPSDEIDKCIRDAEEWASTGEQHLEIIRDALDRHLRVPGGGTEVLEVTVRWAKSIYGYTEENRPFLKVVFANPGNVSKLRNMTEPGPHGEMPQVDFLGPSYESNIPFVSRYMIDNGMGGAMWVRIPHGKGTPRTAARCSYTQIEMDVMFEDIQHIPLKEKTDVGATRAIYFDIEMAPEKADTFPNPEKAGDQINAIACNLIDLPSYNIHKRVILMLDKCAPTPDKKSMVLSFPTEGDLLIHFAMLVRVYDPDWLFGYNSINFDMKAILTRMRRLGLDRVPNLGFNPLELGRRVGRICTPKAQHFESGAIGRMKYMLAETDGRSQYDVMLMVRRDVMCRFKGYSLDEVTKALKVKQKGHMPYEAISILQRGRYQDELKQNVTTQDWFQLMQVLRPRLVKQGDGRRRLFWEPVKGAEAKVKPTRNSHPKLIEWAKKGGYEDEFPDDVVGATWKIVHKFNIPHVEKDGRVFWEPTEFGRAAVADYCADDAICTTEIDRQRMYTMNHIELGRLCFISMMPLLTQGQQVRIISVILAFIRDSDYIVPYHRPKIVSATDKRKRTKAYKGATVVSPFIRWFNGYEDGHIIFMDFAGLYPSIIMAFNLCYTTLVLPGDLERLKAKGVKMRQAPNGHWFVHESVRRGVLPSILETITVARGGAKKGIAIADQRVKELRALALFLKASPEQKESLLYALRAAFLHAVPTTLHPEKGQPFSEECAMLCDLEWARIAEVVGANQQDTSNVMQVIDGAISTWLISRSASDAKQNAIKVVANSVYGFTGAQVGKLPCQEVSSAVTAYGRSMIDTVIRVCESHVVRPDGKEWYAVDPESDDPEARQGLSPYLLRVLYGDTDSAAVHTVGCTSVMEAWRLGKKISGMLTTLFRRLAGNDAITLELEKVCDTELQMGKKRYAKREWKKNAAGVMVCEFDSKGYEVKRRDNPPIVQETLKKCAEIMFPIGANIQVDSPEAARPPDVKAAIRYVHDVVRRMLRNEVPREDYILTKSYSKEAADYAKEPPAHIQFLQTLKARGVTLDLGQRIRYVYTLNTKGTKKTVGRIEDPDYARENNIPIDVMYYIEHNMIKPLVRFFAQIIDRKGTLNKPRHEYDAMVNRIRGPDRYNTDECKRIEKKRRVWLEAAAYRVLFTGDHMRSVVQPHIRDASVFSAFVRDVRKDFQKKMADVEFTLAEFCTYYHIRDEASLSDWMAGGQSTPHIDDAVRLFMAGRVPTTPSLSVRVADKLKKEGLRAEDMCERYGLSYPKFESFLRGNQSPPKVIDAARSFLDEPSEARPRLQPVTKRGCEPVPVRKPKRVRVVE
ncbi:MAG: DNA polymerase domain-containing protein [Bdellovibrionales bacterium]